MDGCSGFCSVLQHCLVALEHTLGNLCSSAFQRNLRETRVGERLNGLLK